MLPLKPQSDPLQVLLEAIFLTLLARFDRLLSIVDSEVQLIVNKIRGKIKNL